MILLCLLHQCITYFVDFVVVGRIVLSELMSELQKYISDVDYCADLVDILEDCLNVAQLNCLLAVQQRFQYW